MPTSSQRKQLFEQLLRVSRETYVRIDDGRAFGVEQHEETLSESLLLSLVRDNPNISVRTFTRHEENRSTGADWMFWWEGATHWFGSVVQAKKLQPSGRFDFGYRPHPSKANPTPDRQIDLLLEAGRFFGVPALYVLYAGSNLDQDSDQWSCAEIPYDESALGAAILPAGVAAWLLASHDGTHQRTVNSYSRPLACLICPGRACRPILSFAVSAAATRQLLGFSTRTPDDDLALRAARSYLSSLVGAGPRRVRLTASSPEVSTTRQGVRIEPPAYVLAAADDMGALDDFPDAPRRLVVMRRQQ